MSQLVKSDETELQRSLLQTPGSNRLKAHSSVMVSALELCINDFITCQYC